MPDWIGLLIGAIVIVLFSFERFNRANYEQRYQLDELMRILAPDQLRARAVVSWAYAGYTLFILCVYLLVCAFSNVFAIVGLDGLAGTQVGAGASTVGNDASNQGEAGSLGISPEVSLGVALIMVGLAPTIPVLKRLEESARYWAHRLAGIPTHVLNILNTLRHREIALPEGHDYKSDNLLIEINDWRRMSHCADLLKADGLESQSFERDMLVVFASSSWILDNQLKMHHPSDRQRFLPLEDRLRLKKKEFIEDLDDLIDLYREDDQANGTEDTTQQPPENDTHDVAALFDDRAKKWEKLFVRADELAESFCMLIAIYVERGIIQNSEQDSTGPDNRSKAHWARQYANATKLLNALTKDTVNQSNAKTANTRESAAIFGWISTSIVLTTIVWSLTCGRFAYELRHSSFVENWYEPVWFEFVEAIFSFCLPLGVALTVYSLLKNRGNWVNTQSASTTEVLFQYFTVAIISWVVTIFIVIGVFIWLTALNYGWEIAIKSVSFVVEYEAIAKFRGVALALLLIHLLDLAQAHPASANERAQTEKVDQADPSAGKSTRAKPAASTKRSRLSMTWVVIGALLIGLLGFSGRYAKSVISVRENSSRSALDAIDGGLVFYATLYSILIGLVAVYIFVLVVRDRVSASSRKGPALVGTAV